ncbi:MAG: AI-2E family transporter [Candidatus Obscuribacterales bacterium]|nr:AI-2E family transporter [Steroidobacteraceae bacterium]
MTTKKSTDSEGDRFYPRAFGVAVTALLAVVLYFIVMPFIVPLLWALFIAFLLHPIHIRFTRQLKGREQLSAALLTLTAFILLVGPLTALSATFVAQVGEVIQWTQGALATQARERYRHVADLPLIGPVLDWAIETFGIRTTQLQNWIAQGAKQLPPLLASMGGQLFMGALNTVLGLVVMLFMLFFFMRDGAEMVATARDLIPLDAKRRQQLFDHLASVTRAVVFGTGMTALIQGTLVGLAFVFTGLSSPLVFGVLAAFLALFPFGGTALVWIPAVFVLASQDQWGAMIVMLIMGVLSSTIDNVVRPLLISGRAEVGTLTVFIGVLGGTAAFGFIGLFLGPVLLALIVELIRFSVELRRSANQADHKTPSL